MGAWRWIPHIFKFGTGWWWLVGFRHWPVYWRGSFASRDGVNCAANTLFKMFLNSRQIWVDKPYLIAKYLRVAFAWKPFAADWKLPQYQLTSSYTPRKAHHSTAHEGPDGEYSSTISLTSALDGSAWSTRVLYPQERDPVPVVREPGWAPGTVRWCVENLARSESLYWLSYYGPAGMPSACFKTCLTPGRESLACD